MEKIILLFVTFMVCSLSYGQGGDDGGGPGMVLKYLDANGKLQQFIVDDSKDIPHHLLGEYMKQIAEQNRKRNRELDEALRKLRRLGDILDITTSEGRNLDRQALRDIQPSWMREYDDVIYVESSAPIFDYQKNDGSIVSWERDFSNATDD